MEKFTIEKKNGFKVPVVAEVPEKSDAALIVVHGFGSSKEGENCKLMLRRMPEAGISVFLYDQPAHGTEEAKDEPLTIENALDSLAAVEDYIRGNYPDKEILYLGSSFGGYISGLYIERREHAGTKLMLRSGAVIMPWLFLGAPGSEPDPESLAELEKNGFLMVGSPLGNYTKVPEEMFVELARPENNLFGNFGETDHDGTKTAMVHGEKDPVIPLKFAQEFAARYELPIAVFPGQGHSISDDPEVPDKVADRIIEFFRS